MKRTMVSNKIWRTIVVAGAMLGTPLAACGGGDKKAATTPPTTTETKPAEDPDAHGIDADSAAAQAKYEEEYEAKQAAEAQAKKDAEDKAAAEAQAKKEADEKAAADEQAKKDAAAKQRPRTLPTRPTGRGFILS